MFNSVKAHIRRHRRNIRGDVLNVMRPILRDLAQQDFVKTLHDIGYSLACRPAR